MSDAKTYLELLGGTIKTNRVNKNISQEELATLSALHRTYISSVERGKRNISVLNLVKIAEALNIGVSDLTETVDAHIRGRK